jgi:hypothetical protein
MLSGYTGELGKKMQAFRGAGIGEQEEISGLRDQGLGRGIRD